MSEKIGFTCAYTPVSLIEAAGFSPFRIFPETTSPDQSGHLLHDNLCPHVKKVLDRALSGDLPDLAGMVFINSCDAMRRLSDAWQAARPNDRVILLDLPSGRTPTDTAFLAGEYERLAATLFEWRGQSVDPETIREKVGAVLPEWNRLAASVNEIENTMGREFYPGLAGKLQSVINTAATQGIPDALEASGAVMQELPQAQAGPVPVFIFGNLLFDPAVYDLFEAWNMHVTGSDFCTGSRFVTPVDIVPDQNVFRSLASAYLTRTPCARTMDTSVPGSIAGHLLARAQGSNAKGVIGFTVKFCDPYLARIPMIRDTLKEAGLPFLTIEGDCTTGAMGQQQTRIEAFTEMLEG